MVRLERYIIKVLFFETLMDSGAPVFDLDAICASFRAKETAFTDKTATVREWRQFGRDIDVALSGNPTGEQCAYLLDLQSRVGEAICTGVSQKYKQFTKTGYQPTKNEWADLSIEIGHALEFVPSELQRRNLELAQTYANLKMGFDYALLSKRSDKHVLEHKPLV